MRGPEFIDVASVGVITAWGSHNPDRGDGVLIRDLDGKVVEFLALLRDGHFQGRYGKIHREDVGEYVIRAVGHPSHIQVRDLSSKPPPPGPTTTRRELGTG